MSKSTRISFGKRIRELRKSNGLTQERLAHMVNIERSYLSRLEAGERNPSLDLMEKFADSFDISLSDLLEGM